MRRWMFCACLLWPLTARAEPPAAPVVIEVSPAVARAVRELGNDVRFFTARQRPLLRLEELTAPERQLATASVGLARQIQALLRAAGVKRSGGAYSVARLTGPNHFAAAFRRDPWLRLLLVRATADGAQQAIVERGGGRPLFFQAGSERLGEGPVPPANVGGRGPATTSFGPLVGAILTDGARLRKFQPMNVQIDERKARAGHQLVVLKIDRDFSRGLGTISFLFGSGFILEPDFRPLVLTSAGGRRHALLGTYAEGPRLELIYEVPRGARQLALIEGEARWPLDPLLGGAQATN